MQNTSSDVERKTLITNPEILVLYYPLLTTFIFLLFQNILKFFWLPYRSVGLHLQFPSIFLQPLYQFGQ